MATYDIKTPTAAVEQAIQESVAGRYGDPLTVKIHIPAGIGGDASQWLREAHGALLRSSSGQPQRGWHDGRSHKQGSPLWSPYNEATGLAGHDDDETLYKIYSGVTDDGPWTVMLTERP